MEYFLVDAVLTLGRTLQVFSLYFQTFRMVLDSISQGFYDGTLCPIFRQMPATGKDFRLERYVTGVAQELVMELWAGRGKVKR